MSPEDQKLHGQTTAQTTAPVPKLDRRPAPRDSVAEEKGTGHLRELVAAAEQQRAQDPVCLARYAQALECDARHARFLCRDQRLLHVDRVQAGQLLQADARAGGLPAGLRSTARRTLRRLFSRRSDRISAPGRDKSFEPSKTDALGFDFRGVPAASATVPLGCSSGRFDAFCFERLLEASLEVTATRRQNGRARIRLDAF
jgi:hypothetical protein